MTSINVRSSRDIKASKEPCQFQLISPSIASYVAFKNHVLHATNNTALTKCAEKRYKILITHPSIIKLSRPIHLWRMQTQYLYSGLYIPPSSKAQSDHYSNPNVLGEFH